MRRRYPWDLWTDGEEHTIYHGPDKDFETALPSMQAVLYDRARKEGKTCTVKTDYLQKTITFQFRSMAYANRSDGLCPRCGEPRMPLPKGGLAPYCHKDVRLFAKESAQRLKEMRKVLKEEETNAG